MIFHATKQPGFAGTQHILAKSIYIVDVNAKLAPIMA
jgi:hypothetical protein